MLKVVAPSKFVSVLSTNTVFAQGNDGSRPGGSPDLPGLIYSPETFGLCYCNHDMVGVPAQQDIGVDILYFNIELLRYNRERTSSGNILRHSRENRIRPV